jgi:hypothetical protein
MFLPRNEHLFYLLFRRVFRLQLLHRIPLKVDFQVISMARSLGRLLQTLDFADDVLLVSASMIPDVNPRWGSRLHNVQSPERE